jgi:N-acetylmuramoyl-L-alanine amidase
VLSIKDHRLVGDDVTFQSTPNVGGLLRPRFLVLHYTAGRSAQSSVQSLCTQKPQGNASAHLVLGRDGQIVQLAPFNVVTWHAGVSQWKGVSGLNQYSIGVEMDNAGVMSKVGDRYVAWFGKEYPPSEVLLAEHRHGGGMKPWHAYTEVQIARALELAEVLVARYRLEDVLGHEDIARGRKVDPGPAFPLNAVRSCALGRGDDTLPHCVVTAEILNIRSGPDASFAPASSPLKKGNNQFIADLPATRATPARRAAPRRAVRAAPRKGKTAPVRVATSNAGAAKKKSKTGAAKKRR